MNYIGSKQTLVNFLYKTIKNKTNLEDNKGYIFADLFAGTGVVSAFYRNHGYKVIANDIQYYSYVFLRHYLENDDQINKNLFDYFNNLEGIEGFIYHNYTLESGSGRNYFTAYNAKKCDAIRTRLEEMKNAKELDCGSYFYYLGSLINSIDKYANTASVYGAFLKRLKKQAQKKFILEPLEIIKGPKGMAYNEDANELILKIEGDILYLDPPYNSRQYAANYHLLETIARYDNPTISGKTGLRDYQNQKSAFSSNRLVKKAFEDLISKARFKYIFLSYNDEGLMDLETIKEIMSKYGKYSFVTKKYRRFKADQEQNRQILKNNTVEYLHCLEKTNF